MVSLKLSLSPGLRNSSHPVIHAHCVPPNILQILALFFWCERALLRLRENYLILKITV
jgi:hypothetical protein